MTACFVDTNLFIRYLTNDDQAKAERAELLLKENMVSPQQLQEALNHQKQNGGKLGKAFVALGFVKDEEITSLLSRQYGVPSINLDHFEVDPAIIKIIPAETARKYQVLPLSRSGAALTIAMADPTNVFAMDDIKFMTGYNVEPVVASESALEDAIEKYYGSTRSLELRRDNAPAGGGYSSGGGTSIKEVMEGPTLSVDDMAAIGGLSEIDLDSIGEADADVEQVKTDEDEIDLGNLAKDADAAPVIKLTNVLLVDSLKRGASDIHIEPYEKDFRVRFRIDGILYNVMALPMKLKDPLTSRIKIMSKLDISEKRLPQDGRIRMKAKIEGRTRELDTECIQFAQRSPDGGTRDAEALADRLLLDEFAGREGERDGPCLWQRIVGVQGIQPSIPDDFVRVIDG